MLSRFLEQAQSDRPVYITDVRKAFQIYGSRPFHIHVTLYDGGIRCFPLMLPETVSPEEAEFVCSYVHAMLYNILSSLGALHIDLYLDPSDRECAEMARSLDAVFQTDLPKARRTGFGKCLNVNERTVLALTQGRERFSFRICDIAGEPQVFAPEKTECSKPVFSMLPAMTRGKLLLGIDIGGTDIKLAVSVDGRLALCKEFDWFPASFATAEELIAPILLLTRLLRAAGTLFAQEKAAQLDTAALSKTATLEEMERGAAAMEQAAGTLRGFDAIGLCFPDVVIRNRIVGGETYKTRGMRENAALDYEAQFAKITDLCMLLQAYTVPGGVVMNTNDGPMAAFTAAVEQAAAGADVSKGFLPTHWARSLERAGYARMARSRRSRWRYTTSSLTSAASGRSSMMPTT